MEYSFLMVLLATIGVAVIMLAGSTLLGAYQDVSFEIAHMTDTSTLAPDGTTTLSAGASPATNCADGTQPQLRGHKWKCKKN